VPAPSSNIYIYIYIFFNAFKVVGGLFKLSWKACKKRKKDPPKSRGVVLAVAFRAAGDWQEAGARAGVHARRAGAPGEERRQQLCLGHWQLGVIPRPGRYWVDVFSEAQQRAFLFSVLSTSSSEYILFQYVLFFSWVKGLPLVCGLKSGFWGQEFPLRMHPASLKGAKRQAGWFTPSSQAPPPFPRGRRPILWHRGELPATR